LNETEKLERAKMYMDKLAEGIDPINDKAMEDDEALNNVRLSRCFFYVSGILSQVIENGGAVGKPPSKSKKNLLPFSLTEEDIQRLETEDSAMITHFAEKINSLIDLELMNKLKYTDISKWLLEKGFFTENIVNGKKRKSPTPAGIQLGISTETKEGRNGPYTATLYSRAAQQFIIDNLDQITNSDHE